MSYSPRDLSTLLDMLLLAQDVGEFVAGMTFEAFSGDKKTKAAVLHALIVVGEASKRLSLDFKVDHPEIPWAEGEQVAARIQVVHEGLLRRHVGDRAGDGSWTSTLGGGGR